MITHHWFCYLAWTIGYCRTPVSSGILLLFFPFAAIWKFQPLTTVNRYFLGYKIATDGCELSPIFVSEWMLPVGFIGKFTVTISVLPYKIAEGGYWEWSGIGRPPPFLFKLWIFYSKGWRPAQWTISVLHPNRSRCLATLHSMSIQIIIIINSPLTFAYDLSIFCLQVWRPKKCMFQTLHSWFSTHIFIYRCYHILAF